MMLENNGDSAASALAVSVPVTAPLWKTPRSVADTQSPIKLETVTDFDSGFIPYEIEYGVVMDQLSRIYKSWKSTIREYIANAESACMSTLKLDPCYVPEIRIEYNPEQCLLTIEDNGIGLSKKMFMEVFRYFGRSRNAFDPSVSGMFGLGAKSFVMLVGDKGSMVIHTKSRETNECYKMYARKVGFDVLPHEDRGYGTSFTFIHDSSFNKLDVVKAIGEFSRYVRVPVRFTISGSPVKVPNPDSSRHYGVTVPAEIVLTPSGPTVISGVSPMVVLDKKIKELNTSRTGYRADENATEYIKLHYDTEHYEFWGLIQVNVTDGTLTGRKNTDGIASLLLISMPTEDEVTELFTKAFIRIKSETGPDWLPKPTPDRERFEESSKAAFIQKLNSDLVQRLPAIPGASLYSRKKGEPLEPQSFEGIGKIESYRDFFSLTTTQKAVWKGLYHSNGFKEHITQATMSILDGLFHRVEEWGTSSIRRRHYNSGGKDMMHEAIEEVIDVAGHQVYIAPVNAKRSASMRTRCTTAQRRGDVVLLSPALSAIPLALKENIPIFRDLSEVELEKIEKANDQVITHTVDVTSGYSWNKQTKRSSDSTHISKVAELERGKAVAFPASVNISEYISLLEAPMHTCRVKLFKATRSQIQWLKGNSEILPIQDYVAWAKRQTLATSKGKIPIGDLVTDWSCVFHSVGKEAGLRLTNALLSRDDVTYVPLTDGDYFKVAAVLHFNKLDVETNTHKKKVVGSVKLAEVLGFYNIKTGNTPDKTALLLYSRLMLEDLKDQEAIVSIVDVPSRELIRIIDMMVKFRLETVNHKSRSARPEVLGQFFGAV